MTEQIAVVESQPAQFREKVNKHLQEGYRVIPGTVAVADNEFGCHFVCFLERERRGPAPMPRGRSGDME